MVILKRALKKCLSWHFWSICSILEVGGYLAERGVIFGHFAPFGICVHKWREIGKKSRLSRADFQGPLRLRRVIFCPGVSKTTPLGPNLAEAWFLNVWGVDSAFSVKNHAPQPQFFEISKNEGKKGYSEVLGDFLKSRLRGVVFGEAGQNRGRFFEMAESRQKSRPSQPDPGRGPFCGRICCPQILSGRPKNHAPLPRIPGIRYFKGDATTFKNRRGKGQNHAPLGQYWRRSHIPPGIFWPGGRDGGPIF